MTGTAGLISVVIASYGAEATIGRTVASLIAQTHDDWEAIIVSDDGRDYRALLRAQGFVDERLRFVGSGGIATGCVHARNVGLDLARGAWITRLDADDRYHPDRLARLVEAAADVGAAGDNVDIVDDATDVLLWRPWPLAPARFDLDEAGFRPIHCPITILTAAELGFRWVEGVDIAEDVLINLAVIDRLGRLPIVAAPLYEYRIRHGSMCHGGDGAERADRSYAAIVERLRGGGFDQIGPALALRLIDLIAEKRAFNQRFAAAFAAGEARNFQDFCAGQAAIHAAA